MNPVAAALITPTLLAASTLQLAASGKIGPLQMDASTRAAIVATMGRPADERTGTWNGSRRYRALGYGCSRTPTDQGWPLLGGGPYCRTVFFLDARDGRLGSFYTTSRRFEGEHAVRIGMPTAEAERRLRQPVYVGCEANAVLGNLTVAFAGGRRARDGHLVGGHVQAFAMHSDRHDVGVFDCL